MKKKEFLALVSAICLTSCQSPDTDIIKTKEKEYPIRFSLRLKEEILPFPSKRDMPDFSIPDPTVANSTTPADDELYDKLEYIVYNSSESPEKLVKHKRFTPSDDDFGIIYDTLAAGNYKIAFLAHSTATVTLNGTRMTFGNVSDTFHSCKAFEVEDAGIINSDIELKRIVSRIEFVSEEVVPPILESLSIEVKPYFNIIDVFTGNSAAKTNTSVFPYQFTEEEKGKTGPVHSFYTFIPSGNETLSATLTTVSGNGTSYTRIVENITPISNKIVRYKGKLYTSKNSDETFILSITNNGAWDQPDSDIPIE